MHKIKKLLFLFILFFILVPLQARNRVGDKVKIYLKNNAIIIGKIERITSTIIYVRNKYALFPVKRRQIKRQLTLKRAFIRKPIKKNGAIKKPIKKNNSKKAKRERPKFLLALSAGYPIILNDFSKTLTPEPGLFLTMGIKLNPMILAVEFGIENYTGKVNLNNKLLIFSFSANANLFFIKKSKLQIGIVTGIGTSYIKAQLPDDNIESAGARFHFQIGPILHYNLSKKMSLFLKSPFVFYVESSSTLSILQIKSGIAYVF